MNSTCPDTNCIVSFQINPHSISNSGLWKVVLEIFRRRPGKLKKGILFSPGQCSCTTSLLWQWLLCKTVALIWLITLHILLIWHHITIFCSHTWQNTWLGSRAVDFGYFCARVPLLIFGRDPGTRNLFLQIVSLFCCMLAPALLATASASVYVLYSTRLDSAISPS